jgi:hypothetical protein
VQKNITNPNKIIFDNYVALFDLKHRKTNLREADLGDSDIRVRGTNIVESIFITQNQVNAAKEDSSTKLPTPLEYPTYWAK